MFQEADDEVGGWVDWHCNGEIYGSGREITDRKGHTFLDWPGQFWLRKETAM